LKRIVILLASAAVLLLAVTASAGASQPTVKLRKTDKGKILVNSKGFTLYIYSKDSRNKDRCIKVPGCLNLWPALAAKGKPTAGPGVKSSLLGTIKLSNGTRQVTYNGWPLYTYLGDSGPGQTFYIGVFQSGGKWYALNASGKVVK
jgi:predicted lipoprotein with Yx(FWY)xxD motif